MDSTETYISLYAGGGGLDMGFQRARPSAQCVAVVEHEASAVALLVDHIEAGLLDAAPVFTDAYTFPAERFHGLVDWVIGGPAWQPFSVAGKQLGADDPRNLWPLTLRMVEQIQPVGCFFENVAARKSLEYVYNVVIPGLQFLGYEVEAGIFDSTENGASHHRKRIFLLAHTASVRLERGIADAFNGEIPTARAGSVVRVKYAFECAECPDGCDEPFCEEHGKHYYECPCLGPDEATDAGYDLVEHGDEIYAIGEFAPGPSATEEWQRIKAIAPERYPAERRVHNLANGMAGRMAALSRSQELRILGNGVVPATAHKAFSTLMDTLCTQQLSAVSKRR